MKILFAFALLLGISLCRESHADTSKDFVRIACVPAAGMLDVENRYLHDSVAGARSHQDKKRNKALLQAGFHDPRGLKFTCVLGKVTYVISAEQDATSNRMCGGSPEVFLSVTRNGAAFLSDVVFGSSCNQLPFITRFTVGDGSRSWRGRETEVCYSSGKETDPGRCE
ncbi:hypothetical protein [Massilia niabensis]|uniref:Uncharacterized protein n=1 Tax=Massilia niabensis TaxID=544910 RepID=A0ABW0KYR4_9BURK